MSSSHFDNVEAAVARLGQLWIPVLNVLREACDGDDTAEAKLRGILAEMRNQESWREIVPVIERIHAGERDAVALLAPLEPTHALIVANALHMLGVDVKTVFPVFMSFEELAGTPSSMEQSTGFSLGHLVMLLIEACRVDASADLAASMFELTTKMQQDENAPPELREFGRVLNLILMGARQPELSNLPDELADMVKGALTSLEKNG